MSNPEEYINPFYPSIYRDSKCQNIVDTLKLNNYIVRRVFNRMERCLQYWTLANNTDYAYGQRVLNYIFVPYIQGCFPFLLSKKSPISAYSIQKVLYATIFQGWNSNIISVQEGDEELIISSDSGEDVRIYNEFKRWIPFLQQYLRLCIPPFFRVMIINKLKYTISQLQDTIVSYSTMTIQEIEYLT